LQILDCTLRIYRSPFTIYDFNDLNVFNDFSDFLFTAYRLLLTMNHSGVRMLMYGFVHLLLEILNYQNSVDSPISIVYVWN
jgi:hypothetical protein